MKQKFILIVLFSVIFMGCNKQSQDYFIATLDNTTWTYYPATEIPLNGGSILAVDEYLMPTTNDKVICWFYSDGTCDVHVQTATRGQTFHTTKWTCSSKGDVVIKKGTGTWMSGLFLEQKLTLNDGLVFQYCGKAKK